MTPSSTLGRALRPIGRIGSQALSWTLLLACLASLAGALWWVTNGKDDPQADIAGFRPYVIASGSMAPGYDVNSFVLTRSTPFDEVREGDVVSFEAAAIGGRTTLHRVIDIQYRQGEPIGFVVKGDNNPHPDSAPVTRDNYLGTAVAHTNASAFAVQQYHAPYGLLRIVILPAVVLLLTWLAFGQLQAGQATILGRATTALLITTGLLASATASYAFYLHQQEQHVVSVQDKYAGRFEATGSDIPVTLQGTTVDGTVDIPRIGVHYPVIDYVAASSLNIAVTHFSGPGLNQEGNVALAGHRAWGNLYFTRIDQLDRGDAVWVTDSNRDRVKYVVTGHRTVAPDDTSVLRQPRDGTREITLISCTYDLRNRYVVTAVAADELAQAPVATKAATPVKAAIWPENAFPVALGLGASAVAGLVAGAVLWLRRRRSELRASGGPGWLHGWEAIW